jgi:small subunit ribosomal protein S20
MPIIKSARKRVKVAKSATARNAKTKRGLRTALKSFQTSVGTSKSHDALRNAQKWLDVAAKKGLLHKNKVARKKSQLAKQAKETGTKITSTKKVAQTKTSAKTKPIAKTAKKVVARKATPKKKTTPKK